MILTSDYLMVILPLLVVTIIIILLSFDFIDYSYPKPQTLITFAVIILNSRGYRGSEAKPDLRLRVADGAVFGALAPCCGCRRKRGTGLGVWGLGYREFRVQGSGFRV